MAVVRDNKLAVPRLDMKPAPPPMPRPPPSDFCSNTAPISTATIMRWMTITTVCIATFRHKPGMAGIRLVDLQGFGEVARCYTKAHDIVTPEIMPKLPRASRSARRHQLRLAACA